MITDFLFLPDKRRPCRHTIKNKNKSMMIYINYMLARSQSMFEYENLPDSVPQRMLEIMTQTNGNVFWTKVNDELYAFTGGLGGERDAYYRPTIYTVANPYLKFNKNLRIGVDGIVMPNDSMFFGLLPMFQRYASMLVENDISMYMADINARTQTHIAAGDDKTKIAAEKYMSDLEAGELSVIANNAFLDALKAWPSVSSGGSKITELIEYHQYLKAGWYNELGLNANYNMKRERIGDSEVSLNSDSLYPLVDDMLRCRQEAIEQVNQMFGTNIKVELSSVWKAKNDEVEEVSGQPENETIPNEDPEQEEKGGDEENV